MIPAVPFILRLAISAICIGISKAGFALASWITPELAGERNHHFGDTSEPKP